MSASGEGDAAAVERFLRRLTRDQMPDGEVPDHVRANLELQQQLECEHLRRTERTPAGQSSTAHKRFYESHFSTAEERRQAYWAERAEVERWLDEHQPAAAPKPETYETALEAFGAKWDGASQVRPWMVKNKTVLNDE